MLGSGPEGCLRIWLGSEEILDLTSYVSVFEKWEV